MSLQKGSIMSKKLIYIVEDEKHIQELIEFNLKENGYDVQVYDNGEQMLNDCSSVKPNLFILDIMLPGIDGLEICRRIKQSPELKNLPILILSAKSEEFDKVLGLELGADDYITKPFSVRELMTRVKVAFRRQTDISEPQMNVIKVGNISVDFERREVYKSNQVVDMTFKEFEILKLLLQNKGKILSREMLLNRVWGFDYFGETRTVDVHIRYLRQKIEDDDNNPVYIETIRGVGYRFNDKDERVSNANR